MTRPPGRPPRVARLDPSTQRPRTVCLDDATFEAARKLGGGSASAGIRLAVERAHEHET